MAGSLPPGCTGPIPSRGKTLALCLPMYQGLSTETYKVVKDFMASKAPPGWSEIYEVPCKGHPAFLTREAITEEVLTQRADVLLWLDSDNGLDDAAHLWTLADRLVNAPEKVGVLGVPTRVRAVGATLPNVGLYMTEKGEIEDTWFDLGGGFLVPTNPKRTSPLDPFCLVRRIGFGLVAVRRQVFETLPKPWFSMEWDRKAGQDVPARHRLVGEDSGFCDAVRAAGMAVVADFSLASECWHLFEDKWKLPPEWTVPFDAAGGWRRKETP